MSEYFLGDPPTDRGPIVGIPQNDLDALHARIRELEACGWPLPPECAPKGIPVLVAGGIAMKKTGGQWFTDMEEPAFERPIEWEVKWWSPIPQRNEPPALTPADAIAAREARDKQVREAAVREAAAAIKEHTDTARKKMRMAYGTPSSGVWSAIISHLDIEHDRILALIEKDKTNE